MTVSRVINDSELVRPATRERVRTAIDTLGYRPNTAARALVTGRTGTLGVVTLDSTLFGPASTLYGIERAAREAGFAITVSSVRRPGGKFITDAVEALQRQAVEGIVVIAPHVETAEALAFAPARHSAGRRRRRDPADPDRLGQSVRGRPARHGTPALARPQDGLACQRPGGLARGGRTRTRLAGDPRGPRRPGAPGGSR